MEKQLAGGKAANPTGLPVEILTVLMRFNQAPLEDILQSETWVCFTSPFKVGFEEGVYYKNKREGAGGDLHRRGNGLNLTGRGGGDTLRPLAAPPGILS